LTSDLPLKRRQAEVAAQSLEECGVQVEIQALPWEDLMAPGPDGPVFGRHFDLAQFAWRTALRPPCSLFTSQEIPGPYPEFPKGWGGGNVTGFSSQEFDRLCNQANNTLPDEPGYAQAQLAAQALFSEALPALPLYLHDQLLAMRPDMCGVTVDPSAPSTLQDLEQFDYGEACSP
jgi:peptide/nickel transport system substrate-binding protein